MCRERLCWELPRLGWVWFGKFDSTGTVLNNLNNYIFMYVQRKAVLGVTMPWLGLVWKVCG
jgi:hypothetical protein